MTWIINRRRIAAAFLGSLLAVMVGVSTSVAQAALDNAALPRMSTPVKNLSIVVFDTETTGFSPSKDRVIEVGAVKILNGEIVAATNWMINPGRAVPSRATAVHGISTEMLKDKPAFSEIYPQFLAFIGDSILMAHNARFDVDFMRAEIVRAELPLPSNATVDTLKLFRTWYPEAKSHKIGALVEYIGLNVEDDLHRGDVDAEVAGRIFLDGLSKNPQVKTLRKLLSDGGGLIVF